jgi:hypothetical protein
MKKRIHSLCLLIILILSLNACVSTPPNTQSGATPSTPAWGQRTQTSNCKVNESLPDPQCTPGDIFTNVTKAKICVPGYAKAVRNVSVSLKNRVYAAYGIKHRTAGQYEVDHLVNLSIGGSNDISNLWPEAAKPKPGFHEKDQVENYLHDQVCAGKISLQAAQAEIATNWLAVFQRMPKSYPNTDNENSTS